MTTISRTPSGDKGRIPIHLPGGPVIGYRIGRMAVLNARRSRNFYRLWNSWTIDARVVIELRGLVDVIAFDDRECQELWTIPYGEFVGLARQTTNRTGVKLAVAERHWRLAATAAGLQPDLFQRIQHGTP